MRTSPFSYHVPQPRHCAAQLRALQLEHLPGFQTVLASCIENGILYRMHWAFETLGKTDKKFLLIHVSISSQIRTTGYTISVWIQGTNDRIVPFNESNKIKEFIPQAELYPIEGASHYLVMEEGVSDKVAEKLVQFLS